MALTTFWTPSVKKIEKRYEVVRIKEERWERWWPGAK